MIPTMLLFGMILGRWWKTSLLAGTLFWPLLLWFDGVVLTPAEAVAAAGLGLLNTLLGVAVHQVLLRLLRVIRAHPRWLDQARA